MPKKKKETPKIEVEGVNGAASTANGVNGNILSPATQPMPSPSLPAIPAARSTTKKTPKPKDPTQQPSSSALIICRNKHWRYISSFHGPWLQLPPEILETLANTNYNTPRPRPIDPAVFFDLVKIRRLVDEATNLAVRAATGVASTTHQNISSAHHHAAALGLGIGFGGQAKLSRERKYRMREQATQKLSKAYHLDEIACSVATMQGASPLEEVASLVLQRNAQDPDAKYVHFFHEKIPSRQLAECTNLTALNDIILDRPTEAEPLRTRATVRVFKDDLEGAVADLTDALRVHRLYRPSHTAPKAPSQELQVSEKAQQQRNGRWHEDIILKEENQPSSLEIQLLFQRAGVYLTLASQHVSAAFPVASSQGGGAPEGEPKPEPEMTPAQRESLRKVAEARKLVRLNAKRALRDYTAYLSYFEYSPDLPIDIAEEFARKVNFAANGVRVPRAHPHPPRSGSPDTDDNAGSIAPHCIYALSKLFTATPPSDLPPYPNTELTVVRPQQQCSPPPPQTTTETLTYHPLMTDALHALLLCHCLIQTSAKELLRHAYMVARLARLADGYPVFQASRSPARADWLEVLRAGGNWIQLVGTWEDLCAPAPLPLFQSGGPANALSTAAAALPIPNHSKALPAPGHESGAGTTDPTSAVMRAVSSTLSAAEAEKKRKERIHQQAVLGALNDDRVSDESSFRQAIRAHQLRAERDYRLDNAVAALDAKLTRHELDGPDTPKMIEASAVGEIPEGGSSPASGHVDSEALVRTTNGTKPPPPTSPGNSIHPASTPTPPSSGSATGTNTPGSRRWTAGDEKEYSISTERATAVARWVVNAPPNGFLGLDGARRKKKKGVKKGPGGVLLPVVGAVNGNPVGIVGGGDC
ncbi:putative histidine kinase group protein [Lasiosphaeria hispida]|uniref:Histidine kinase group protein n=1 Tax=Lasiosphaeria hispida TaxID=260671 RepID=A0AAJ0HIE2_9PEZI|nr:putative histidine kinase group protein [Lasiosphaeria hispida]